MKTKQGKIEFAKRYVLMCKYCGGMAVDPATQQIYEALLSEYNIADVIVGINGAMKHWPHTNRLIPAEEIIKHIHGGENSVEDHAIIQSHLVLNSIKTIGRYQTVRFEDRTTSAVITQLFGGWVKMCSELEADKEKWFLKDFQAAYKAYKRQNIGYEGNLIGLVDATNEERSIEYKTEPVLIGYDNKQKQIES